MRSVRSMAGALTLAALLSGGQAIAAGNAQNSQSSIENPSLLGPLSPSFDAQNLPVEQNPLERLFLSARLASVGSLDPVNGLDPVDLSGDRSADAYGSTFRAIALANSPYALLTSGGSYFGSTIPLGGNLHAQLGAFAIGSDRPLFDAPEYSYLNQVESEQALSQLGQSESGVAGLGWDFASWGSLGLTAAQTTEQNGLLSGSSFNAMVAPKSTKMSTVGMNARVGFGSGWVSTLSYNEGLTQLALKPSLIGAVPDTLHSRGYSFAVAKHGLFDENDSLGLALTRPLQVYSGGTDFSTDGVDASLSELKLARPLSSLTSATPETDFELGYVTTFLGGSVSLQANAGYQMNVDGFGGTNALSVISRAKINF